MGVTSMEADARVVGAAPNSARIARKLKVAVAVVSAGVLSVALLGLLSADAFAGKSAYVVDYNSNYLYQFNISSSTGALTAKTPSSVGTNGSTPRGVAVSPDARNVYLSTLWGTSQFDISAATGALTAKTPSYVALGGNKYSLAVSPDGGNVYVSVDYGLAAQYTRDLSTGLLTAKSPETVISTSTYAVARGIAVSADGGSAYVIRAGDNSVYQYDIDPVTGVLTAKATASVAAGSSPFMIAVTPDGESAYVTGSGDGRVYQYDISQLTGELAPKNVAYVSAGSTPYGITVSPDGESAYVANYNSATVSQYDINQASGALLAKTPATVSLATKPTGISMHPNGGSLYVTHLYGSASVSQFNVDATTGVLTAKTPATVYAGSGAFSVAVTPGQSPTAAFTAPSPVYTGTSTSFSGSGSSDPDGTVARYDWNFGDGTTLDNGGPTPSHTYVSAGNYNVTLTVTDDDGCSTDPIFTGQTAYCNGSSGATTTEVVTVSNPPPPPDNTALPAISGTPNVGQQLSCSTGTWTNSPTSYAYQWKRDGSAISGATSSTYTLVAADADKQMTCMVTASNAGGSGAATSDPVTAVGVPANTVLPAISGTPNVGQQLSCSQGTWANSPTSYAYQWKRDNTAISGATSSTYTLVAADADRQIRCAVTASNAAGSASATSSPVTGVGVPANTALPAISGTPNVGQELSCSQGTWANSPTSYAYQWQRNGSAISGATSSTYSLVAADADTQITCAVTAANAAGSAAATSDPVTAVGVPANTTLPAVSGTPNVGQELSCSQGTWANSPTSYAYQWQRDNTAISGATSSTYSLVVADADTQITCAVTAANAAGSAQATSDPVTAVGVPENTTLPAVSGTPNVGQELSCSQGTWANSPTSYAYQWQRDGSPVSGATSSTSTLVDADAGRQIRCTVTAQNAAGSGTATSAAVAVPSPPPGEPQDGDTTAPVVTILSGPPVSTNEISATFVFTANEDRVGFMCELDNEGRGACGSPTVVYGLAVGPHEFKIWAQDRAGNTGEPAVWSWSVDQDPPGLKKISIRRRSVVSRAQLATISGLAADKNGKVGRVMIKLRVLNPRNRPPRKRDCVFRSLKSGHVLRHACDRYFTATSGTDRWKLKISRRVQRSFLRRDLYRLLVRVRDEARNVKTYPFDFQVR